MSIDVIIDKLTPCLVEVSTGKEVQTVFSLVTEKEITGLNKKGWFFDWTDNELK